MPTPVNVLAISVGNTRTRIGAFVDGQITETATFRNSRNCKISDSLDATYAPLQNRNASILLSSVNPPVANWVEQEVAEHFRQSVVRVERDLPIPIGRQLDPEALVGEDRLLNAAAAYDVLQQACVVVDAGTAMTIDFVDGAGTFHGGAITPGAQLMLDALHQRTALLPEVELARPDEPIGHSTIEALRSGVFYGMRGIVRELVERYAESVGSFPMVVATGGDADLLFRDFELVERVIPDLTLIGIATTLRVAAERAQQKDG